MASVIEKCSGPFQREVERVAADVAGGLQPAGERELAGFAAVRAWQQAVLDFGGEDSGTERCPHSNRSVKRRLAMTT